MAENFNHRPNVENLGPVENGLVRWAVGFRNTGTFQEFPTNDSGIPDGGLVDCHHVVS
ncbi:hypothetical protein DPMN_191679 [Dreissena polymorpha]|uniref:Uncharacterized protein n=1 Tax=Dreissena polymorpha TaxID=45954 RepID=A0A9D3Y463_DREPO|nr:hypothetical protein DPMN_191679 [Dreissena polymorpha]